MKHVVIVDSMSNIPAHVLETRRNIKAIPLNVQIDGKPESDTLGADQLREFYTDNPLIDDAKADATSPTPEQISVFLLNEIAPHYDYVIFQSTSAALSDVYKYMQKCAQTIENDARVVRKMAGITAPFKLVINNSGNSSSGQALIALYTDALLSKGLDFETVIERVNLFKEKVKTHSVIKDVMQARTRMKMAGQKTISLASAVSGQIQKNAPLVSLCNDAYKINHLKYSYKKAIKSLFEYAQRSIEDGLYLPIIYLSYAGRLRDLRDMKEFQALQSSAKKHGVTLILGMMSVSACINYSTGSLSLGIAPKDETLEPA